MSQASWRSQDLMRLIVDNVSDYAIFATDTEGRILSWNPGVKSLLGYDEAEWVGQVASIIFTAEDLAQGDFEREMVIAAQRGRAENLRWHVRKDGSSFWANGFLRALLNEDGSIAAFAKVMRDDSERRLAELRVQESEERFRTLFHSIEQCFGITQVLFDASGRPADFRLLEVNPQFEKLVGLSRDELLSGRTFRQLVPALEEKWIGMHARAVIERVTVPFQEYFQQAGRWFEGSIFPMEEPEKHRTGFLFSDVSERIHAELLLRQSEQQLRTLADAIPQLVSTADANGLVLWHNRRWTEYTGLSAEELQGWGWLSVLDPAQHGALMNAWRVALSRGQPFESELRLRGADGQFRWFLTRLQPYTDWRGRIVGWFGTNTDVDELRRAHEEQARANRLKDDFLATLSHELRTPLASVLGWSTMLQSGGLNEDEVRLGLQTIERNARVQKQLIEDLLDVSRIVTGKLRLELADLDLASTLEAAVKSFQPAAEAKGLQLEMDFETRTVPFLGDAARLQQVFSNLVSNAIKFTPSGGWVKVLLRRGETVSVTISDSGQGISPHFLPHVFERFCQADQSTTRKQGGLGLGLAIVRQLVELHGGSVAAHSPGEGQGSSFTVTLPLVAPDLLPSSLPPTEIQQGDLVCPPELPSLNILVLDDEPDNRALLRSILGRCGARVTEVATCAEALAGLKQQKYDVIISDIGMPVEDGFDFIAQLRRRQAEHGGATPALALTAYAGDSDRERARAAGFQAHLAKPVDANQLVATVAYLARGQA